MAVRPAHRTGRDGWAGPTFPMGRGDLRLVFVARVSFPGLRAVRERETREEEEIEEAREIHLRCNRPEGRERNDGTSPHTRSLALMWETVPCWLYSMRTNHLTL